MTEQQITVAIVASEAAPSTKPSNYPEPFASRMAGSEKRPLGDVFTLTNFGVNLTRLLPCADSATYPDDDIQAMLVSGAWQFAHKDGTLY